MLWKGFRKGKKDDAVGNARKNYFSYFTVLSGAVCEPVSVKVRTELWPPKRIPLAHKQKWHSIKLLWIY